MHGKRDILDKIKIVPRHLKKSILQFKCNANAKKEGGKKKETTI